ncbi:C40 family peptidase [Rivibacter subsaxonicus]|uniref:Cell wall-associated NlpC family hydrolase n=1 Tax=Rivibacter subsaxonicus TaxID=457575 RepID=A0A4Q7VNA3_9BURK|nr:C40 family peptidase [Rivibacter subsaxonicus]RZT97831.1 cell wall-associated NlpC family hydrolase [Rivibacter subsaxonicus]
MSGHAPRPTLPRALLRAAAACALALSFGVHAAPDELPGAHAPATAASATAGADPVLRLLHERGFLDGEAVDRTSTASGLAAEASDWATGLIGSAMNFLGVRYRRGGQSVEQGFDCSGFTRHVFEASVGLMLPRRSKEQASTPGWLKVERAELKPGDLVFFNTLRSTFSHVGIYVGDGKFIHAPRTGGKVRVEDMRVAYWSKRFNGARRAPEGGPASTVAGTSASAVEMAPAAPGPAVRGAGARLLPTSAPVRN